MKRHLGESGMNKEFWRKFAAAFAAAGWVYAILHMVVGYLLSSRYTLTTESVIQAFTQGTLALLAVFLLVIVGVLFLVANPLEKLWDKKGRGITFRILGYIGLFLGLTVFTILLYVSLISSKLAPDLVGYPNGEWFIIVAAAFFVSAVVAAIARPIYPVLLRRQRLSVILASVLVGLALIGPISRLTNLNPELNTAPVGTSFFPPRMNGELARGTWNKMTTEGAYGTGFYVSGDAMTPHGNFELIFACLPSKNPIKYQALVFNQKNQKQVYKVDLVCSDSKTQHISLKSPKNAFVPRLMLSHLDSRGAYRPAWAILAPWSD